MVFAMSSPLEVFASLSRIKAKVRQIEEIALLDEELTPFVQ